MKLRIGSGFGAPEKYLADNDREFANQQYHDMCQDLNIDQHLAAAERPWQKGACEHNHVVIDHIQRQFKTTTPFSLVLGYQCKNALQMWSVYSYYHVILKETQKFLLL